ALFHIHHSTHAIRKHTLFIHRFFNRHSLSSPTKSSISETREMPALSPNVNAALASPFPPAPSPTSLATTQAISIGSHTYTPAQIQHFFRIAAIVFGFILLLYLALVLIPKIVVRGIGLFIRETETEENLAAPESPFLSRPEAASDEPKLRPLALAAQYRTTCTSPRQIGLNIRSSLVSSAAAFNFRAKTSPIPSGMNPVSNPKPQCPVLTHVPSDSLPSDPLLRAALLVVGGYYPTLHPNLSCHTPPAYAIPQATTSPVNFPWLPTPKLRLGRIRKPPTAALLRAPSLVHLRPVSVFRTGSGSGWRSNPHPKRSSTASELDAIETAKKMRAEKERTRKEKEKEKAKKSTMKTKENSRLRPLALIARLGPQSGRSRKSSWTELLAQPMPMPPKHEWDSSTTRGGRQSEDEWKGNQRQAAGQDMEDKDISMEDVDEKAAIQDEEEKGVTVTDKATMMRSPRKHVSPVRGRRVLRLVNGGM
ncbi:hypothetical protein C8F01DRAFT_193808, partial [Mycena amicta]